MKVRCVKLADSLGRATTQSPWLTIGQTYHVLSVVLDSHSRWLLRLIGDEDEDVGLFLLEQFEVLTSCVPAPWVVSWSKAGIFELSPRAWLVSGFWERYFDRDQAAKEDFDRERNSIIQSDP